MENSPFGRLRSQLGLILASSSVSLSCFVMAAFEQGRRRSKLLEHWEAFAAEFANTCPADREQLPEEVRAVLCRLTFPPELHKLCAMARTRLERLAQKLPIGFDQRLQTAAGRMEGLELSEVWAVHTEMGQIWRDVVEQDLKLLALGESTGAAQRQSLLGDMHRVRGLEIRDFWK